MNLCNIDHGFNYELEKLCRIFLPHEKINILDRVEEAEICAVCRFDGGLAAAELSFNGNSFKETAPADESDEKARELALASCLFKCFVSATDYTPEWGLLTGVRPAKLYSRLLRSQGREETDRYFRETLFVSEEKISLCAETVEPEEAIVSKNHPDSFSLYLSVPFCPSRCSYCSFVSHSVDKAGQDLVAVLQPVLGPLARSHLDRL